MTNKEKIAAGLEQMALKTVDNGVLESETSIPATYGFRSETTYQPEAFEDAVAEYDFDVMDISTEQKDNGDFYYYADVKTDHYKKVSVKVWKKKANLYPKEENVDTYEVSRIIHAIEDGFESKLEHRESE